VEEQSQTVLAEMGRIYRGLESYSDSGFEESIFYPGTAESRTRRRTFKTYFKRPNQFRFEWSDHMGVNVIWCDGKNAFAKCSYDKQSKQEKSLGMAIAGATGVSGGTAHTVSTLLMEEVSGRKLTELKNAVYRGVEMVNGEACHYLEHDDRASQIYISESRLIILKIDEDYVIQAGSRKKAPGLVIKMSFQLCKSWLNSVSQAKSTDVTRRSVMFRSFQYFKAWLHLLPKGFSQNKEDLHITSTTVYKEVLLNPDLPDELFCEAGDC